MLFIETIDNNRIKFGYNSHQFKAYKNHCNKMKKLYKNKDSFLCLIYSLESNMAKFKLLNSLAYLYKNLNLLQKFKRENKEASINEEYEEYIKCFISNRKNISNIEDLIALRHKLADFYSFLDDIYILSDNRHNFDQYKIKYLWNDITVVFETQKICDSFLDGSFSFRDFRFNTQLAILILDLEKSIKTMKDQLKNNKSAIDIFDCVKHLNNSVSTLKTYLADNFVESEYIKELSTSVQDILSFVKAINDYQNGNISIEIRPFTSSVIFKDIEADLQELNRNKKVDSTKLSSILLETVERRMKVDERARKMPFLPVFYDIAYDFIEYPKSPVPVVEMFENFEIQHKN